MVSKMPPTFAFGLLWQAAKSVMHDQLLVFTRALSIKVPVPSLMTTIRLAFAAFIDSRRPLGQQIFEVGRSLSA
jgi:ribose/xylose/arabinose/galactoside ABC-type transport system permease subunit